MLSNKLSEKQASKYLREGDAIEFIIRAEKVNGLLDPAANFSPLLAGLEGVVHILVTNQAILLVGTNGITGGPGVIKGGLPRTTSLGPLSGKKQNRIVINGQTYKVTKSGAADVIAADQRAGFTG